MIEQKYCGFMGVFIDYQVAIVIHSCLSKLNESKSFQINSVCQFFWDNLELQHMKKAFLLFLSVVHRGGIEVEAIVDVDFSTLGNQPYHSHDLETEISL